MNAFCLTHIGLICLLVHYAGGLRSAPEEERDVFTTPLDQKLGSVWPQPQIVNETGELLLLLKENFKIFPLIHQNCPIINKAIERYYDLIFPDGCLPIDGRRKRMFHPSTSHNAGNQDPFGVQYDGLLSTLVIIIKDDCEEIPTSDMDESYELGVGHFNDKVPLSTAILLAQSVWGALRGLETFSQLVYEQDGQFLVKRQYIQDFPRFPFRGLLVDTSRHFIPVSVLLQTLDAMAYNKMNVFHWHIVDDPSFPFVSKAFPGLSQKGAYNPETHIYSPEDVQQVIEYASLRGIRVVPEFDTPGHTLSWGKSQPGLLTPCPDGNFGPINPVLNSTYTFLDKLFQEVTGVFKDELFHAGGDEVNQTCWRMDANITDFMKKNGLVDYDELLVYYLNRTIDILHNYKRTVMLWEDVLDHHPYPLNKDAILNVWREGVYKLKFQKTVANITSLGYKVIVSACWYFDQIRYGQDWVFGYKCDPNNYLPIEQQKLVLGGEATMWSEFIDGSNLMSRTWPRASSTAERLWSSGKILDMDDAILRLQAFHCRMQQRGIRAEPVIGPSFCPCDIAF